MTPAASRQHEREVVIGHHGLGGTLVVPADARGLVIFAHGSGSSRFSPRNRRVARELNAGGLATLLLDLLTAEEAEDRDNVFDIALLGSRVAEAITWARGHRETSDLPIGLFGASTGAAAALVAAAISPEDVMAVVSRGGRPDLAGRHLAQVRAPTLLIVGGEDHGVIALNEAASRKLACDQQLAIVPGAAHLFEEKGALEQVIVLASRWFNAHLAAARPDTSRAPITPPLE